MDTPSPQTEESTEKPIVQPMNAEPMVAQAAPDDAVPTSPIAPITPTIATTVTPPVHSGHSRLLIVVGLVALLLIGGAFAIVSFSGKKQADTGTSTTTTTKSSSTSTPTAAPSVASTMPAGTDDQSLTTSIGSANQSLTANNNSLDTANTSLALQQPTITGN